MPNTPNINTSASLVTPPAVIKTNLGPVGGAVGEIEELDTKRLTPIRIIQSEGGELAIEFEYNLAAMDERLKDLEFINGYEQLVEVEQAMPSGVQDLLLAWGEILTQEPKVDPTGERARIIARVTPHHFGTPLVGMHVLNHAAPTGLDPDSPPLIHEGEIWFNPEIDGKITGNTTTIRQAVHEDYDDSLTDLMILKLWVNPESLRTDAASTVQRGYELDEWDLKDAVHTLCKVCNPFETFLINPTLAELDAIGAGEIQLRNLVYPTGLYLNELLNLLLKPHGYSWYLQVGRNQDSSSPNYGSTEIRIKVFKLGEGIEKEVNQPKPGTVLAAGGPQNCIEWDIRESFDELRNQVTALGGLREREITIELFRGWDETLDNLGVEDLGKDGALYERQRNVWRLWVANEAGDWNGSRGEITSEPDLSGVLGDSVGVHRRPIHDCLTLQDKLEGDTKRRPPLVEWRTFPTKEIVTIKPYGNAPAPIAAMTFTWYLKWKPASTILSVGPYDESTAASTIVDDLGLAGISTIVNATGDMGSAVVLTWDEGVQAPDFWIEATFTGGLNPGIAIRTNFWQPIPDGWGPVLLAEQMGVYFNGDKAVEDLFAQGDNARIRITGTLIGDTRLTYTAEKNIASPLGHVHEMVIDVSDRFFDRSVQRTGQYMSALVGIRQDDANFLSGADEADDTDAIEAHADLIRSIEDAVNITGSLTLAGIRPEYEISDLITRIEGRVISLNRVDTASGFEKYVQITEIETIFQPKQRTVLKLLPLDQTEAAKRARERRHRRRRRR